MTDKYKEAKESMLHFCNIEWNANTKMDKILLREIEKSIIRLSSRDGIDCYSSNESIAKDSGLSIKEVTSGIKDLERVKRIEVKKKNRRREIFFKAGFDNVFLPRLSNLLERNGINPHDVVD